MDWRAFNKAHFQQSALDLRAAEAAGLIGRLHLDDDAGEAA